MNLVFSTVSKTKIKSSFYSANPFIENTPRELNIQKPIIIKKVDYNSNSSNANLYNMISRIQYDVGSCSKCGMN